jgi:hypothetical protein
MLCLFYTVIFITIFYLLLLYVCDFNALEIKLLEQKGRRWGECSLGLFYWFNTIYLFYKIFVMFLGEVLELKNVTREMSGEYVCSADNGIGLGPVSRSININVLCKYIYLKG